MAGRLRFKESCTGTWKLANPPSTVFILLELVPLHYSKYGGLPPTKVTSLYGELQASKQD